MILCQVSGVRTKEEAVESVADPRTLRAGWKKPLQGPKQPPRYEIERAKMDSRPEVLAEPLCYADRLRDDEQG